MHFSRVILLIAIILSSLSANAQFRFINTYYYNIDSISGESDFEVHGIDNKITNRYINFQLDSGTIDLNIKEETLRFETDKQRNAPHHETFKPFHISRNLTCRKNGLRYAELSRMKLIEVSNNKISIECRFRINNSANKSINEKIRLEIPFSQLQGLYIGTGGIERTIFTTAFWGLVVFGIVENEIIN
ncbi:MAG: hypothetical protein ACFHWX_18610 [Bacteroidota bacterium]